MADSRLFYNQYLISKIRTSKLPNFIAEDVGDFTLYAHPAAELATNTSGQNKLFRLGFCFDYRNPQMTNQQIVDNICISSLSSVLSHLRHLSGVYIVIVKFEDSIFIVPDMCAFREVYYHKETAAASPNLLRVVNEVAEVDDSKSQGFFQSEVFRTRLTWVGEETSFVGVKRLKPNHYLDLNSILATRFFPVENSVPRDVNAASASTCNILEGIVKAVTKRGPAMMGLTAGWDSRVLLTASRSVKKDILYFLTVHKESKIDALVSRRLAEDLDLNYFQNWSRRNQGL